MGINAIMAVGCLLIFNVICMENERYFKICDEILSFNEYLNWELAPMCGFDFCFVELVLRIMLQLWVRGGGGV